MKSTTDLKILCPCFDIGSRYRKSVVDLAAGSQSHIIWNNYVS